VPEEDAFCGKCGYAMRDQAPDRLDQSRIRVHEEPEQDRDAPDRATSQQRIRKHTVLGMPSIKPSADRSSPGSSAAVPPPAAPTPITSTRGRSRASQKTMLGIPRPELSQPLSASATRGMQPADDVLVGDESEHAESGPSQSHRARARVRYDSANEPYPVVQRRRRALFVLGALAVLAAAWLGYRFFTVHG
jgi:hypothetical protein